ncbi:hypothetical protein IGI01_28805 [Bacillus thuringiensis]|nr:hypothetical protein [Bacillus thuringiensis]
MKFKVKSKKFIASLLACAIMVPSTGSAFAETQINDKVSIEGNYTESNLIPAEFFNPNHPDAIQDPEVIAEVEEMVREASGITGNQTRKKRAAAAAAVYFIPGVGQVALLATGAVVVGGATYWAGSWIYTKVQQYLSSSQGVPSSLKKKDGSIDLGKFKDKVKGKTAYKDPKTGWTIEKDTAGHGGRKWKLKDKKGNRKASLDGNGRILSK